MMFHVTNRMCGGMTDCSLQGKQNQAHNWGRWNPAVPL
ncbi:hypothetical protein ApDm4_0737 [Acetobacter pomorum]|nr:hypothetical protein ApDm4_0737 [Acetobacter pomorum]